MDFRKLTKREISLLEANGCRAENWENVEVKEGFLPERCREVFFSGKVRLGIFKKEISNGSGIKLKAGIEKAIIHNCIVSDNVFIYNIKDYIANYFIDEGTVIRNCGRIYIEDATSFGNGIEIDVMNESGGRRIRIWDKLSAHLAYIMVLYRHRPEVIGRIEELINNYAKARKSNMGYIGSGCKIINCATLRNVWTGPRTKLEDSLFLNEGSINSSEADPVYIGPGVIMDHFIISSGSTVTESAMVERCFIGQGCFLGKQFSAHNSLFFANCQGFHGEVYSVFAGPYTVTHHKSTLLIAGIFSFMNAGSGSNQSNHMYKLGPVHQGVVERGTKTASDSYILWPARIGPYSLVTGRHLKNIDTSAFPFSYVVENNRESILIPALNLVSSGTIRDAIKWPGRDVRKDREIFDYVYSHYLTPYTAGRMIKAIQTLEWIKANCAKDGGSDYYCFKNNLKISLSALERGVEIYKKGLDKFAGDIILKRISKILHDSEVDIEGIFSYEEKNSASGEWLDLAGLIVPSAEVEKLLDMIEGGILNTLDQISMIFSKMHAEYEEMEWLWVVDYLEKERGKPAKLISRRDILEVLERYIESLDFLGNKLLEDAEKEFSPRSMTGFGIDGNENVRESDYFNVRGSYETNPVVEAIRNEMVEKKKMAEKIIEKLIISV